MKQRKKKRKRKSEMQSGLMFPETGGKAEAPFKSLAECGKATGLVEDGVSHSPSATGQSYT